MLLVIDTAIERRLRRPWMFAGSHYLWARLPKCSGWHRASSRRSNNTVGPSAFAAPAGEINPAVSAAATSLTFIEQPSRAKRKRWLELIGG